MMPYTIPPDGILDKWMHPGLHGPVPDKLWLLPTGCGISNYYCSFFSCKVSQTLLDSSPSTHCSFKTLSASFQLHSHPLSLWWISAAGLAVPVHIVEWIPPFLVDKMSPKEP